VVILTSLTVLHFVASCIQWTSSRWLRC